MTAAQALSEANYAFFAVALSVFSLTFVLFQLAGIMQRTCLLLADLKVITNRNLLIEGNSSKPSFDGLVEYPCCVVDCERRADLGGFCASCPRRELLKAEHPGSLKFSSVPPENGSEPLRDELQNSHVTGNKEVPLSRLAEEGGL